MVQLSVGVDASAGAPGYERHRPKKTLLYQLVEQYYPAFVADLSTVFYAFSAIAVMKSSWSPLVANAAVSVPVVVQDAWLNVLRCWWTKY